MTSTSHLKILLPHRIDSHPYIQELYSRVAGCGVSVSANTPVPSLLSRQSVADISVIHLHWLEYRLRSAKGLLSSLLKTVTFIARLLRLKLMGKKIVITLHNITPHERLHRRLEHVGFRCCLALADAVIVHNEYSRRETRSVYGIAARKIHVIPHGNFVSYYPNVMSKGEARQIAGIPDDRFVMLFFGAIRPYKGVNTLLAALGQVLVEAPDTTAVMGYRPAVAWQCLRRLLMQRRC